MASEKIQKILAISKNIDKKGGGDTKPKQVMKAPVSLYEQIKTADQTISQLDEMYKSPYVPTKEELNKWNCERGRNELTEMSDNGKFLEKLKQSKLPSAILESMAKSPCNYDISTVNSLMGEGDPLFKKLEETYGKKNDTPTCGTQALLQINETLDKKDKEKKQSGEDITPQKETTNITELDTSILEDLLEKVIDRKLKQLTEKVSNNADNQVKVMCFTNNGSFRFLDSENNVYECQMKYIGKKKTKK